MARAAVIPGVSAADALPQQRSTRGRPRTAALPEEKDAKKAEPAKRGRKPGKTVATRNKKDEVVDHDDGDDEDDDLSFDMTTTATTVKGRAAARPARKAAVKTVAEVEHHESEDDDDDELADFEVPKKKTVRPKVKAAISTTKSQTATTATTAAKATRGRPKTVKVEEAAPVEKRTRGRKPAAAKQPTGNTIYVTTASTASSLAKTRPLGDPTKKKKVTFADLDDSEDDELEQQQTKTVKAAAGKKTTTAGAKAGGLKAKPVRKAGAATRGRPPKSAAKPLSPKKATQLAKGSASSASSGEEDELASEKNIYSLIVQKSPVRSQEPQHTGLSSPVKRIMLPDQSSTPARPAHGTTHQDENLHLSMQPPSALRDQSFMGSPARRPPPSTSKETIRDTPRRGPLFANMASASKLSSNPEATTFLQKLSPLKASPKKGGNLGASFLSASPDKASATPFNAKLSLLQSPAKRVQSPFIFRKLDTGNLPQAETTARADDDVDTEMYDDTFANNKSRAAMSAHFVVDEPSDDELAVDGTPVKHSNNGDDVFVDHSSSNHEQIENEDYADASNADDHDAQDDVEIIEDFVEHVNTEVADEHANEDGVDHMQQPFEAEDEDVIMSNDEMLDSHEDVEEAQPTPALLEEVQANEEIVNTENNAEMEEDIPLPAPESVEQCESQDENVEAEQPVIAEDAEQPITATELTKSTEEAAKIPDEVETADSEQVVIYADPEEVENDDDVPEVETPRSNTTLTSARSSIDPRDIVGVDEIDENDCRSSDNTPRFVPPAAPSPPTSSPVRLFRMSSYRDKNYDDTYSEYGASPASRRQSMFSGRDSILPQPQSDSADHTFSSLTAQLSSWKASSPAKMRKSTSERSIFSPVVPRQLATPRQSSTPGNKYGQIQSMRRSLAARHSLANSVTMDGDESDALSRQTQDDETEQTVAKEQQTESAQSKDIASQTASDSSKPRLSMSITPVRVNRDEFRTVHTVSKVPLKPEGDESPLKYTRKRARSMTMDIQLPIRASPRRVKLVPRSRKSPSPSPSSASPAIQVTRSPLGEVKVDHAQDSEKSSVPETPTKTPSAPATTPRRTPKANQQFLRGAVVFVDVHTTEGEDASGIFIELLTQMGAKCIKSWHWNPNARSSQSPGVDGTEPANNSSKVGITHVVYKDGGVRTLEKVRQAGNLVKCVGVGWVLDCERANKWLDEEHYCVDSTIIPRGGAKRRKSMQPRALSNVNGSLTSSTSSSSSLSSSTNGNSQHSSNRRSRLPSDWDDTVQDLRRMSPSNDSNDHSSSTCHAPKTPTSLKTRSDNNNDDDSNSDYNFNFNFDFSTMSPATPGFLSQNSHLTQQTCPPKQTNQGLFSSYTSSARSGVDMSDSSSGAGLRAKLEAARRKSLAFKPRFGSPLSRS